MTLLRIFLDSFFLNVLDRNGQNAPPLPAHPSLSDNFWDGRSRDYVHRVVQFWTSDRAGSEVYTNLCTTVHASIRNHRSVAFSGKNKTL